MNYHPNYQPPCSEPKSAFLSNAAGYTMCSNCASDPVLGPVWHETRYFQGKREPLKDSVTLTLSANELAALVRNRHHKATLATHLEAATEKLELACKRMGLNWQELSDLYSAVYMVPK